MKVQWNGLGLGFEVNWTMQHTNRVQSGVAQSVATALQDAAAWMNASLGQMACDLEETLERRESVLECGEKALRRAALDANDALDSPSVPLPRWLRSHANNVFGFIQMNESCKDEMAFVKDRCLLVSCPQGRSLGVQRSIR